MHLALPARRLTSGDAVALARRAEALGWRGVWCSEVLSLDALVLAGVIAAQTTSVAVGTAVVPISTRTPAVLAMAASTIAQLAPGRFSLGLGVSTPEIVDARHARPVAAPLRDARDVLSLVRGALRGDAVSGVVMGASVQDLTVDAAEVVSPVHLAALGPHMTDLAYQAADGLLLNMVAFDDAIVRHERGVERRGSEWFTGMLVRVLVDPTADSLASLRRELASYARVPAYARDLVRQGVDVGAVIDAPDLAAATAALTDDVVDALAIAGREGECRDRLLALEAGGVTPMVVPVGGSAAVERALVLPG